MIFHSREGRSDEPAHAVRDGLGHFRPRARGTPTITTRGLARRARADEEEEEEVSGRGERRRRGSGRGVETLTTLASTPDGPTGWDVSEFDVSDGRRGPVVRSSRRRRRRTPRGHGKRFGPVARLRGETRSPDDGRPPGPAGGKRGRMRNRSEESTDRIRNSPRERTDVSIRSNRTGLAAKLFERSSVYEKPVGRFQIAIRPGLSRCNARKPVRTDEVHGRSTRFEWTRTERTPTVVSERLNTKRLETSRTPADTEQTRIGEKLLEIDHGAHAARERRRIRHKTDGND